MQAVNLETCLKIGATLGNGSEDEVKHLGKYGSYLSIILELWKDFHVSVNLTLELAEKIKSGALPYSLLWAREHSEKLRRRLDNITSKSTIEQVCIKRIVEDALEIKALDNTAKIISKYAKKAEEELIEVKKNNATRTLQFFIEAQQLPFIGSLSVMQAHGS